MKCNTCFQGLLSYTVRTPLILAHVSHNSCANESSFSSVGLIPPQGFAHSHPRGKLKEESFFNCFIKLAYLPMNVDTPIHSSTLCNEWL